jgi:glycosyltransferase involved in cell wall biosynthesis
MFVSCLMPTRGRPALARQALLCWLAQSYPSRELVIIDDRDDPSFPNGLHVEGVQYHMIERRLSVGQKRNIACSRAHGEVLMSWDSDDWCAPERIESQLMLMSSARVRFVGYNAMTFFNPENGEAWKYTGPEKYALGTSLCFRRELWETYPFPDLMIGEDNAWSGRNRNELVSVDAGEMIAARIHGGNTSPKIVNTTQWARVEWPEWLPAETFNGI